MFVPLSRREIFTSSLVWLASEGRAAQSGSLFTEEETWEAIHNAAQVPHYFHIAEQDPRDHASAEQVAEISAVLAAGGISSWWDAPADRDSQRAVQWLDSYPPPFPDSDPAADLRDWVIEATTISGDGTWWSVPHGRNVLTTSRGLAFAPAIELIGHEDELGRTRALLHPSSPLPGDTRILEVATAADWIDLVESAPMGATISRHANWGRRLDPATNWVLPNWTQVARDFDALHLTVNAYLDLSGIPLDTQLGKTMIAGWGPDETVWLTQPPIVWERPYLVYRHDESSWSTTAPTITPT